MVLPKTFYDHQKCLLEKWIKCKKKTHHFIAKIGLLRIKKFIGGKPITIAW